MKTISINCPYCKHPMEYWTKRNYIECTKCNEKIDVEPCTVEEELEEDLDETDIEGE